MAQGTTGCKCAKTLRKSSCNWECLSELGLWKPNEEGGLTSSIAANITISGSVKAGIRIDGCRNVRSHTSPSEWNALLSEVGQASRSPHLVSLNLRAWVPGPGISHLAVLASPKVKPQYGVDLGYTIADYAVITRFLLLRSHLGDVGPRVREFSTRVPEIMPLVGKMELHAISTVCLVSRICRHPLGHVCTYMSPGPRALPQDCTGLQLVGIE